MQIAPVHWTRGAQALFRRPAQLSRGRRRANGLPRARGSTDQYSCHCPLLQARRSPPRKVTPDARIARAAGGSAAWRASPGPDEVDVPALHVGPHELHANAVADLKPLEALLKPPLDRRAADAHP